MRIATLLLVVGLAGCASPVWNKPGGTQAMFDADKSACEYEALKYSGGYDPTMRTAVGQGMAMGMRRNELATACMGQKGWTQTAGQQEYVQPQDPFTPVSVDLIDAGGPSKAK